jgi:hypothetical protein
MAITFRLLGEASVALGGTDVYTVPPGKAAVISTVSLVNTHTAAVVLDIYAVIAGTQRRVSDTLSLAKGAQALFTDILTLGAGDKVRIQALVASVIDAVVCGVERDA